MWNLTPHQVSVSFQETSDLVGTGPKKKTSTSLDSSVFIQVRAHPLYCFLLSQERSSFVLVLPMNLVSDGSPAKSTAEAPEVMFTVSMELEFSLGFYKNPGTSN